MAESTGNYLLLRQLLADSVSCMFFKPWTSKRTLLTALCEVMPVTQRRPAVTPRPGDYGVQLGGPHSWLNRTAAASVLAQVIVGATALPGEQPR